MLGRREVKKVKEKEKDKDRARYIVPLGPNFGGAIMTDPMGSYTGLPLFSTEEPVQDADDL